MNNIGGQLIVKVIGESHSLTSAQAQGKVYSKPGKERHHEFEEAAPVLFGQ